MKFANKQSALSYMSTKEEKYITELHTLKGKPLRILSEQSSWNFDDECIIPAVEKAITTIAEYIVGRELNENENDVAYDLALEVREAILNAALKTTNASIGICDGEGSFIKSGGAA